MANQQIVLYVIFYLQIGSIVFYTYSWLTAYLIKWFQSLCCFIIDILMQLIIFVLDECSSKASGIHHSPGSTQSDCLGKHSTYNLRKSRHSSPSVKSLSTVEGEYTPATF